MRLAFLKTELSSSYSRLLYFCQPKSPAPAPVSLFEELDDLQLLFGRSFEEFFSRLRSAEIGIHGPLRRTPDASKAVHPPRIAA